MFQIKTGLTPARLFAFLVYICLSISMSCGIERNVEVGSIEAKKPTKKTSAGGNDQEVRVQPQSDGGSNDSSIVVIEKEKSSSNVSVSTESDIKTIDQTKKPQALPKKQEPTKETDAKEGINPPQEEQEPKDRPNKPEVETPASSQPKGVKIIDAILQVDSKPFDIKAICWSPMPKGLSYPDGLAFKRGGPGFDLKFIERDLKLISEAGFNTVRTYEAVTDKEVLDMIHRYNLKVIVPAFNYYGSSNDDIRKKVSTLATHPTTLFWEIGNEWNYNNFYNPNGNTNSSVKRVKEVIALIRGMDSTHPIASNYGELPSKALIEDLDVDLWGINVYRSANFGDLFDKWKERTNKPMYIGEYGADAIDDRNNAGKYAPEDQAFAARELTKQIMAQYASQGKGMTLGGALFEFSDEWWKDSGGSLNKQDIGGIAPGGGPYPDQTFNEEWWGIVDIDRNIRPAYSAMKELYNP